MEATKYVVVVTRFDSQSGHDYPEVVSVVPCDTFKQIEDAINDVRMENDLDWALFEVVDKPGCAMRKCAVEFARPIVSILKIT